MAKFIALKEEEGSVSATIIVNIDTIDMVRRFSHESTTTIWKVATPKCKCRSISGILQTPDEIHALIEKAQGESPEITLEPLAPEEKAPVDLSILNDEQKAEELGLDYPLVIEISPNEAKV